MSQVQAHLDFVELFARRVIEDALNSASVQYWLRRAETLDAARPRPGDFPGMATQQELAETDKRLADTALECRRHAAVLRWGGLQ